MTRNKVLSSTEPWDHRAEIWADGVAGRRVRGSRAGPGIGTRVCVGTIYTCPPGLAAWLRGSRRQASWRMGFSSSLWARGVKQPWFPWQQCLLEERCMSLESLLHD